MVVKILVELARIDGSLGWNAMTTSVISLFVPLLPEQTYRTDLPERARHHLFRLIPAVGHRGPGQERVAREPDAGRSPADARQCQLDRSILRCQLQTANLCSTRQDSQVSVPYACRRRIGRCTTPGTRPASRPPGEATTSS